MRALEKIKSREELRGIREELHLRGRHVVFTNGCFDLLHRGHVRYLEAAGALGDALIVAVNTDRSITQIKGPLRPIMDEESRAELVAALHCVDYVTLFDTPDPLDLIELLLPDFLVKGADWPEERIVGARAVREVGGQVVRIPLIPDISTTIIIQKIAKQCARPLHQD